MQISGLELSLSSWQKLALLRVIRLMISRSFQDNALKVPHFFLCSGFSSYCQATSSGEDDLCVRNSLWAHLPSPDHQWEFQFPCIPHKTETNPYCKEIPESSETRETQLRLLLEVFIYSKRPRAPLLVSWKPLCGEAVSSLLANRRLWAFHT